MSVRAYVALGSNLGDSQAHLDAAIEQIVEKAAIGDVEESPRYVTTPMGPEDQPNYVNSVCRFDTELKPLALLDLLQSIELDRGRIRPSGEAEIQALRWHARSLDLDVLLYGDQTITEDRLIVPHPGIGERVFVLQPLFDLEPMLMVPGVGSVAERLAMVDSLGISPCEPEP